jgi:hypothetical protein
MTSRFKRVLQSRNILHTQFYLKNHRASGRSGRKCEVLVESEDFGQKIGASEGIRICPGSGGPCHDVQGWEEAAQRSSAGGTKQKLKIVLKDFRRLKL